MSQVKKEANKIELCSFKKAQVSMEFIIIVGFVFLLTIPLVIVFFEQTTIIKDAISTNHIRNIAIRITDRAETIYYLGEPSKTTIKTQFPENIERINITTKAVIFEYRNSKNDLRPIIVTSAVNLSGNISINQGIHNIEIESLGGLVSITES